MSEDNIVLNSCQYTPVYFIENPGVSQTRSYVLAPNTQGVDKPVSESLKRFYENSGKLESNLNVAEISNKPRIIKKHENSVVGNNLKLASFLLPKCETKNELSKQIIAPVNNVVLKPVYIANNINVNNANSPSQVPKLDVNSKIVKLKDIPNIVRSQNGKILPKIKPKENLPSNKQKHKAVQLVKLGETYHSLNQLSNDQMKIVNHALQIFSNSQSSPPEPAYDPATNTKFIYKVVSQKDLALADRNKVNKNMNVELNKDIVKIEKSEIIDEPTVPIEAKVTRSGRVVKLPRNIIMDDSPSKLKRKISSIVSCLQCGSKFSTPQRLHRHYENHPSHLPTKLHSNLFHCLIAIVTAGSESERANILINQLEQFIDKLKSCIPCILKTGESARLESSVINEDISKLFGINPGKYNLNIDALSCEKDIDGYCSHNPPPPIISTDNIKPHLSLQENNENGVIKGSSNVLKSKFLERRPTILRKVEYRKQKLEQSHEVNGKKIKLSHDTHTNSSSLELDDLVALLSNTAKTDNKLESKPVDNVVLIDQLNEIKPNTAPDKLIPKPPHIQFHSTHFDIRSSPIKPTSTVFRKFQINPEKMAKYEIEIIRPIHLNQLAQDVEMRTDDNSNTQNIFNDSNVTSSKESDHLNYTTSKDWLCDEASSFIKSSDLINSQSENFMKPNDLINSQSENFMKPSDLINSQSENFMKPSDLINSQSENFMKPSDLINSQSENFMKPSDLINSQSENFMKSTDLINSQSENFMKPSDLINNQSDSFMKSNTLIEPALLHVNSANVSQVNDKSVPGHVNNGSDVANTVINETDSFMKSNNLMEPMLLLTQDDHKVADNSIDQNDDFMKSDILIEQALLHNQNGCKVMDELTNSGDDFMKSNILIESEFLRSQDDTRPAEKYTDHTNNIMKSLHAYIDPTLSHISDDNKMTDVTENNEIDIDLSTNQGQSIISFLESLGNELTYTETEGRNISNDFQLDLFSFNHC